eukprot:maker-scaffold1091_size63258-snap-gene-0.14 protein:Tk11570 transcript:maker-scaffold1091_size63258-snap-gene-0.14-mRNA-1 annotation:"hypothetical protein"
MKLLVISLLSILTNTIASNVDLKSPMTADKKRNFLEYLGHVTNISRPLLVLPQILRPTDLGNGIVMPSDTPRSHMGVYYVDKRRTVLVGVFVENFSKYRLTDPRTSANKDCSAVKERNELLSVDPGHSEFIVIDNDQNKHYGVCGTLSWQISNEDGTPVTSSDSKYQHGLRLVITYDVRFKGSCGDCGAGRENSFAMTVIKADLNNTNHWVKADLMDEFWDSFHGSTTASVFHRGGRPRLGSFNGDRFLVQGEMECGCKPMLWIQFLPGPKYRSLLWSNEKLEKVLSLQNQDEFKISGHHIPKFVLIVVGAFGLLIMVVAIILGVKKCRKSPDYQSAPIN